MAHNGNTSNALGRFYFHCVCAEMAIYKFPMKIFTPEFDSFWPRRPYRDRYFGDLNTFSVDFCIRYAECPPHFYFRSTSPTDLESVTFLSSHCENFTFEVIKTICCLVIAFLLLIHYVTFWPRPLTFWPWSVVIHGGSHDMINAPSGFGLGWAQGRMH